VANADLQIAYDGEILRDGTMDVRELAPALLAVGDLCQEANSLLNGQQTTITVHVKAITRGSFELHLVLAQAQQTLKNLVDLFPGDLKSAQQLAWLLFGSQGGMICLIELVRLLRGKPIQPIQILQDGSTIVDLTNANLTDSQITITAPLRRLYEDEAARKAVERIVKPLEHEGIEVFQVREQDELIQQVSRKELDFFRTPATLIAPIEDSQSERVVTFQIVTASFEDRYQWRLTDGNMTLTARIEDEDFFKRIDAGERFGKGDILRIQLHEHRWRDSKGLHAEYRILKVLEVIPTPRQMRLA